MGRFDRTPAELFNGTQPIIIDCKDKDFEQLIFAPVTAEAQSGPYPEAALYKKGPILEAIEKRQPVVLKNLDLAKAGTTQTLPLLLQLATGELQHVEIVSPAGDMVSYDRNDLNGFDLGATVTDLNGISMSVQFRLEQHLGVERPAKAS
jgi:hypothetical protein